MKAVDPMAELMCQSLIDEYLHWLREGFLAKSFEGGCIISTPFLDRHNDAIELFVERRNNQLWLTDDGYTLSDLRASGMEFSTEKRRRLLDTTLNGFGVRLEQGELCVAASPQDFAQKKHRLIQTILTVNDMFVMAEPHVLQLFKEDVAAFLGDEGVAYLMDFKLSGKSGYDHKFDFGLPKTRTRPERVVQAVNHLTKDLSTSLAFAVGDVVASRPEPLGAFAVLNDEMHPPNEDHLQALRAYDIAPLFWSQRHRIVESLNGTHPGS